MHRAWIDTKVALGGGDKTILESVEAGEDRAKEAYQKAIDLGGAGSAVAKQAQDALDGLNAMSGGEDTSIGKKKKK